MAEQTPAQKKAHAAYISKFARLEIRTTLKQRDEIQVHAEVHGESVNSFINRAIGEQMERDREGGAEMPSNEVYNQTIQFVTQELSQVIRESKKETYTQEELLQLLAQVANIMKK